MHAHRPRGAVHTGVVCRHRRRRFWRLPNSDDAQLRVVGHGDEHVVGGLSVLSARAAVVVVAGWVVVAGGIV